MTNVVEADPAELADPVALTRRLIDVPSESFGEAELADQVYRWLAGCGHLQVHRVGNTVIARTELGRAQRLVLAGHLDTVPANDNLPHRVEGERIFGLGACDMKGGVAVALSLATQVSQPKYDVTYLFYDCEEVDSVHNGLRKMSEADPTSLACDFAVLLEPSNAVIEAGCQGSLRVQVTAVGQRAHSARAWMGDNAIHHATEILNRLALYRSETVEVDGLAYREGLNAVGIVGGVAGNVIPDECIVTVNYRYAPSRSADQAVQHVTEIFDGFEVTVVDNAPGALPGLSSPIASELAGLLPDASVQPKLGWTDVSRFSALGIPAVNFGPGDPTLAHTQREFVTETEIATCYQVLTALLTQ